MLHMHSSIIKDIKTECMQPALRHAVLQLIVLGGHNGGAWLDNVMTHRPHSSHWSRLATLDSPRSFAAAETWRDNVYILGGGDGSQWFSSVLRCAALPLLTNQHHNVTAQVCQQSACVCSHLGRTQQLSLFVLTFLHTDACILSVQAAAM